MNSPCISPPHQLYYYHRLLARRPSNHVYAKTLAQVAQVAQKILPNLATIHLQ